MFRKKTTVSCKFVIVFFDKHSTTLKLHELQTLIYIFYIVRNQLTMYTEETLNCVTIYVIAAMTSDSYVETAPTVSKYVICR